MEPPIYTCDDEYAKRVNPVSFEEGDQVWFWLTDDFVRYAYQGPPFDPFRDDARETPRHLIPSGDPFHDACLRLAGQPVPAVVVEVEERGELLYEADPVDPDGGGHFTCGAYWIVVPQIGPERIRVYHDDIERRRLAVTCAADVIPQRLTAPDPAP